jgi:hypothetical protein
MNQLLLGVQSKQFVVEELTEFLTILISTLQLFPDFIVQFESFDRYRTNTIKEGELLNTECNCSLNSFGYKDSAKIATF